MANTNNYAEQWSPELLEIIMQESLISPFITTNVRWVGAKTFHFTQMSTSGYQPHNRAGGWNKGQYTQTDHPYTLTHDRDVSFLVDKADVDETNSTASAENISKTFTRTQSTPEANALFFSKCATLAVSKDGYNSETALSEWTKDNVYSKLKTMLGAGKLRRYKGMGALVAYVRSEIMDLLEQSTELQRKIEMTQIAEGGMGLETRVTSIDGVPIFEVIDDEVFYSSFDFSEGFEANGQHINVLIASPLTTKFVPKINSIYFFAPGQHTEGDGYLYQNRALSDVFTFPNGKDGQVDSVYVDLEATA
ncbi:MAG: phage capsid protein [Acutalibacteraceae bacterium]|nr:phage capsid protein [Acutalibacteraceae bacterium]